MPPRGRVQLRAVFSADVVSCLSARVTGGLETPTKQYRMCEKVLALIN